MKISRRSLLAAAGATAITLPAGSAFAQKAEFSYKYANNLPVTHPMNLRAKEMADAIRAETKGRVDIQLFPNNQLGSDTDMLSQLRSGGIEFFTLSGLILSTLVPATSISGIGFAFGDYDAVWKAMDGDLGAYIRAQIVKAAQLDAQQIIEATRRSAKEFADKQQAEAVAHAADLLAKARSSIELEHKKMLEEARGEVARLVITTTERVLAKRLTDADRAAYNETAARELTTI